MYYSINFKFITSILTFLFIGLSNPSIGQKSLDLFFEGELTSRGHSVNDVKLLVIDQSGFHSFIPVNNKFKFAITPNRKFVISALKKGYVTDFILLDTKSDQIPNGTHSITRNINMSQYDPTSDKWKKMTKLTKLSYTSISEKFESKTIELEDSIRIELANHLFNKQFKELKNACFALDPGSTDEKFASIYSQETKDLQKRLKSLQTEENKAKERIQLTKQGLKYAAQIGAFSKEIPSNHFFVSKVPDLAYLLEEDGIYRYYSGDFDNLDAALTHITSLKNNGISDAFAIAIYGGKRVTIPQESDSTRNPDIDKWNAKLKKIQAELEFLNINETKLVTQKTVIESELEEINNQKKIAISEEDTLLKKRSLSTINLNMKKNAARKKIKTEKLKVAQQNLNQALKGEIFAEDGRTRIITDTILVDKPVYPETNHYGWEIGFARGLNHVSNDNNGNTFPLHNIGGINNQFSLAKNFNTILRIAILHNIGSINSETGRTDFSTSALQTSISIPSIIKHPDSTHRTWDLKFNLGGGFYTNNSALQTRDNVLITGLSLESRLGDRFLLNFSSDAYFHQSDNLDGNIQSGTAIPFDYNLVTQLKLSYLFDIIIQKQTSINQPGVNQRKL